LEDDVQFSTPTLFDQTATAFTAKVDKLIAEGRYRRGNLFLDAALSAVPAQGYVLDFGCGPGRISALLARKGFRVLGVDPSPVMISTARQQRHDALNLEFELCETRPIDSQENAFDAIVCSSVIEYERRPVELLRHFFTALRPSGLLIISFANSRSLSRTLFQRRNLHLGAQVHTWSLREFSELLEQGGFKPIRDAVYFESFFDRIPPLHFLSASQFAGALGLIVAAKQ
jgi:2-polyprenyl-3-methyl-5-hydroxy-6-metoxy-1,4-benzoquinol methylase